MKDPVETGDGQLLTIKQAAEILNVSEVSLRRWTDSGRLPCLRIGGKRERRFRREDLMAFLEQPTVPSLARSGRMPAGNVEQLKLEGIAIDYGSHLCNVYDGESGGVKMAVPFLAEGLAAGDICYLAASPPFQKTALGHLQEVRPEVESDIARRRLVITDGADSGQEMYEYLEREFLSVTRSGGRSIRVLGDMAWFLDRGLSADELVDFEMRFDRNLGHCYPVVSLCQYDARRFSGVGILHALLCHTDTLQLPLNHFLMAQG